MKRIIYLLKKSLDELFSDEMVYWLLRIIAGLLVLDGLWYYMYHVTIVPLISYLISTGLLGLILCVRYRFR